ncbi:hypothetical protein [Bacillus proteolyticus]|uniref:hypothetical protein n=1 Tax=Bacillus proteolyticus TaxID=2026192 RepID=UPI002E1C026C|nr:hypothetical protein [Bacillus proteolyticus]
MSSLIRPIAGELAPVFGRLNLFKLKSKFFKNSEKHLLLCFIRDGYNFDGFKDIASNFNLKIIIISDEILNIDPLDKSCFIFSELLFEKYVIKSVPTLYLIDFRGYIILELYTCDIFSLNFCLNDYFKKKMA